MGSSTDVPTRRASQARSRAPPTGRRHLDGVALLGQQLPPHVHVPVLDLGQLRYRSARPGVGLGPGQLPVEEGGVGLVGEVVEPVGGGAVMRGS